VRCLHVQETGQEGEAETATIMRVTITPASNSDSFRL
jgi:hypothetical protein